MTNSQMSEFKNPPVDFQSVVPISDHVVTVRPMSMEDAETYALGTQDEQVKRFAHLPLDNYTPEVVETLIDGAISDGLREGTLAVLTIADTNSDAFLGSLVFFDVTRDDAEIGYWVAKKHRGRRISSRALALSLDIGRALDLKRLRARTVEENPASQRVLTKTGFMQAGEPRPQTVPSGKTEMSVDYVIEL